MTVRLALTNVKLASVKLTQRQAHPTPSSPISEPRHPQFSRIDSILVADLRSKGFRESRLKTFQGSTAPLVAGLRTKDFQGSAAFWLRVSVPKVSSRIDGLLVAGLRSKGFLRHRQRPLVAGLRTKVLQGSTATSCSVPKVSLPLTGLLSR